MGHHYIGNGYDTVGTMITNMQEALSHYSVIVEQESNVFTLKINSDDIVYMQLIPKKGSSSNRSVVECVMYDKNGSATATITLVSVYQYNDMYLDILETMGKGLLIGGRDGDTPVTYDDIEVGIIDGKETKLIYNDFTYSDSTHVFTDTYSLLIDSSNASGQLTTSPDSIQLVKVFDNNRGEFLDDLWYALISKPQTTLSTVNLASVGTQRFYLVKFKSNLPLAIECTDKYAAIPSVEPSEGEVIIVPIVTDGVEIARINDISLYAPEVDVRQALSTGVRIAKINDTNIYAPEVSVTQVQSTGTVIAKINNTSIYAPNGGGVSYNLTPAERNIGTVGMLVGTNSDINYPINNTVVDKTLYERCFYGIPLGISNPSDGDTRTLTYGDCSYEITYYVTDDVLTSFEIVFTLSEDEYDIYPVEYEAKVFGLESSYYDYLLAPFEPYMESCKLYESAYGITLACELKSGVEIPNYMFFTIRYMKQGIYT